MKAYNCHIIFEIFMVTNVSILLFFDDFIKASKWFFHIAAAFSFPVAPPP